MDDALRDLKVVRYAPDGGYSPREWARAVQAADLPASDAPPARVGVQITKSRVVDVVIRVEPLVGWAARLRAVLGRSRSDRLFASAGDRAALGMGRSLAVLAGRRGGAPGRVLVAEPAD